MSTCMEVSNLTKSFKGRRVVNGLSFEVKKQEVFGLLGHNGAVTSLVYFPMLFLSGATIPFELFPSGLQKVASVLPLTQGIKLMKAASMGTQVESVMGIIILLVVITIVCTFISIKTFRWE